jgi:hypothetical protein
MSIWVYGDISREPDHVWSTSDSCTFCRTDMKLLHHQTDDISARTYKGSRLRRVLVCPVCGWWKAEGFADGHDFRHASENECERIIGAALHLDGILAIVAAFGEIGSARLEPVTRSRRHHPSSYTVVLLGRASPRLGILLRRRQSSHDARLGLGFFCHCARRLSGSFVMIFC